MSNGKMEGVKIPKHKLKNDQLWFCLNLKSKIETILCLQVAKFLIWTHTKKRMLIEKNSRNAKNRAAD